MKRIALLGSTGSIGVNALNVIGHHPDKFRVTVLSCDSNFELLARQAKRFRPLALGIRDASKTKALKARLGRLKIPVFSGPEGLEELAGSVRADLLLMAICGNASLLPLVRAIESKKDIALASKEPLVSAGEIIVNMAARNNVSIIPLDSEHSAIFQCLGARPPKELRTIYLTGSGGPLREVDGSLFDRLPITRVLAHPKWKMGKKITVDSATLMNKGLEAIEAKWLFGIPLKHIKVLIHPEAIVHSMVEFIDGTLLAQLALPDMRLPIQYALNFPDRLKSNRFSIDFTKVKNLSFDQPDNKRFPCLGLAYRACERGGSFPAVLNAANEEAVRMYLEGRIKFTAIPEIIEKALDRHKGIGRPNLEDIIDVDNWAREEVNKFIW